MANKFDFWKNYCLIKYESDESVDVRFMICGYAKITMREVLLKTSRIVIARLYFNFWIKENKW